MNSFIKYNWLSLVWAAFIFYMCMISAKHLPKINIPHLDKIVHFTFYTTLVVLMNWGWKKQTAFSSLHQNPLIKIFFIACAYGLSIEIMQELFTTDRHFEWLDEVANSCGAGFGSLAWLAVKRYV